MLFIPFLVLHCAVYYETYHIQCIYICIPSTLVLSICTCIIYITLLITLHSCVEAFFTNSQSILLAFILVWVIMHPFNVHEYDQFNGSIITIYNALLVHWHNTGTTELLEYAQRIAKNDIWHTQIYSTHQNIVLHKLTRIIFSLDWNIFCNSVSQDSTSNVLVLYTWLKLR